MEDSEYESLPTEKVSVHLMAGAIAGVMEHCVMYPVDSVKTRMQSLNPSPNAVYKNIFDAMSNMIKREGVFTPVRGMTVVAVGAGPAHALYFSSYEAMKRLLTGNAAGHNPIAHDSLVCFFSMVEFSQFIGFFPKNITIGLNMKTSGQCVLATVAGWIFLNAHQEICGKDRSLAGVCATVCHDAAMNPVEVVKQRMQMYGSPYRGVLHCASTVFRQEGIRAFYRSYTTQLSMNIPFQSLHFVTYEFVREVLNPTRGYDPKTHLVAGAAAGAFASAVTTPLDVAKTLLNTQERNVVALLNRRERQRQYVTGMVTAIRTIYTMRGFPGYFQGLQARVIYQMPSCAICWSVYEFFKNFLHTDAGEAELELSGI